MSNESISTLNINNLKKMRSFIDKRGRPTEILTDRIWQKIFYQMKEQTIPYINGEKKRMYYYPARSIIVDDYGEYECDDTSDWKRYCQFINESLRDLRSGEVTICFYRYQITQILLFHKDNLMCRYNEKNRNWELWLKKGKE